ncbi:MAG: 16S rRNA (guanine(527)-N(7))-methyltransferase RsmG [Phycisphaerales bacterium]|nr:16S rRNA (guanine(527)-N(7))-methyltransferase RsmG [Phycisphaerales bacterium]
MTIAMTPPDGWTDHAAELGISFEQGEIDQLGRYLALLMDANTRMNLTAIRDETEAWDKHILDALTLVPVLAELREGACVVDIGSGGGIPGLPLAIVMPHLRFTLVDATAKKCRYLEETAESLGLRNVRVINDRAERLGNDRGERSPQGRRDAHREQYDMAVARAVGRMAMLVELTVPLVKVGGLVVLTKGQKADEELAEAKQALYMLHTTHAGTIDTPTGRIVVLEKQRKTPRDYPRGDGEPKRSPLGVRKA